MTDSVFEMAESVLLSEDTDSKVEISLEAGERFKLDALRLDSENIPVDIGQVKMPPSPMLVDPRHLPKRKLTSKEGRIALLHSVAHIEFSAIQLAWDHLYRFRGMPEAYYWDWLGVAVEEARHFAMIRERLRQLDADYGDLPAHGGLWSLACETAYDVMARMALVPRFMEARGLDVTPGIMERLAAVGDDESVACLRVILEDEVGHVALGSRWFLWLADQRSLDAENTYFDLLDRHMEGQARGPFNDELRRKAGFSEGELTRLQGRVSQ